MAGKKVLLVEDDKFLREMLAQKLIKQELEVQAAVDGKNALDILANFLPDLIILDLLLPDIDGFGVLENVRKNDKTKNIPVVVLSNLDKAADMERAQKLGANDFMVKSNFSVNEIISRAKEMLGIAAA
ncbi:MAG: response regulator [Candidatus Paceibacterota bacterium]|jgi:DNA-binding response OmpR family regulator